MRVFSDQEVECLLPITDCIEAVEQAFRLHAEGRSVAPRVFGLPGHGGGVHAKGAGLELDRLYLAVKLNSNFPDNPQRHGLPTIQGVLALFDGADGRLLALMASGALTAIRTGAATAVAARHLARPEAAVATIVGCGVQAPWQLRALAAVLPLRTVHAVDLDTARAETFARTMSSELGLEATSSRALAEAVAASDVLIACTTARSPVILDTHVRPGTFVAAVGADNEHKQEVEPALLGRATVVADASAQAATGGELHWAIAAGLLRLEDVHAELADVVAGRRPGRRTADEITLFDSTGVALEDVAAAVVVCAHAGVR